MYIDRSDMVTKAWQTLTSQELTRIEDTYKPRVRTEDAGGNARIPRFKAMPSGNENGLQQCCSLAVNIPRQSRLCRIQRIDQEMRVVERNWWTMALSAAGVPSVFSVWGS
jgi:hypothetical protein